MKQKVSLKAFWEAVEERLSACSVEDLRAILRAMAQTTPPSGRRAFLDQLEVTTIKAPQAIQQEDLLADVDDFAQELKEAMQNAGDWEERYEWGGYYDE
jgi:uncharacterized protein (DUF1501 family)